MNASSALLLEETPRLLNFLARVLHPPRYPLHFENNGVNLPVAIEHNKNLPATLLRSSYKYFLLPSLSTFLKWFLRFLRQHSSIPSSKVIGLFSPNLIQLEKPRLLSKTLPITFPFTTSTMIPNDLHLTLNQPFLSPPRCIACNATNYAEDRHAIMHHQFRWSFL